ncbi:MAG: hypothetical protein E7051_03160 [Lentisphaerae bacterium]|nr:hypothetical protein [Lentisphaerota bacterium]
MEEFAAFIRKHLDATAAILIFLVTLCFFLPSLNFAPVPMDNTPYSGMAYLLTFTWQNFIYHLKTPVLDLYSPLVMHSLMLDNLIWGNELLQAGGRLHNIILHSSSTVIFYFLLRELKLVRLNKEHPFTLSIPSAVFGALCFALHPQRIESVIWLAERKDVQAVFLGFLSTLLFIRSFRKNRLPILGALCYFLSFGAKPTIITLPGVLLLGIWVCTAKFDWKKALKMLSPYIAAAVVYILLNMVQLAAFAGGAASGAFTADRLEIVVLNYTNYFFKTLFPLNIQPLYPLFRLDAAMLAELLIFWGGALILAITALVRIKKHNCFSDFIFPLFLAFAGTLLPMAGFKVIGNAEFADRYSYYPSIFIWIGLAAAVEYYSCRQFILKFTFWAYASLIAVLGLCYLYTWQSEDSFINAALGDGVNANPAVLRMASWSSFEKQEYAAALNFAYQAANNSIHKDVDPLFIRALEGMIELAQGNGAGLEKIDSAITDPKWGYMRRIDRNFSENALLVSANTHLARKTPADEKFAIGIFHVLGCITEGSDPAKELNYRAIAAYLAKDYALAEDLMLQALRYAPGDKNMRANLENFRALKNRAAKAASTE